MGEDATKLYLRGGGWYQFGQVVHSTDTLNATLNYNNNWYQNSGAQFTVIADIGENLQGAMGLGGKQFHATQGKVINNAKVNPGFAPYITEARISYFTGSRENSPFLLHLGFFPYQYNRDVRNLGAAPFIPAC